MSTRRQFLRSTALASAALAAPWQRIRAEAGPLRRTYQLRLSMSTPVRIASVELLEKWGIYFVRVRSEDGAEGIVQAHSRTLRTMPIFKEDVVPYFMGQDAREIERLVDDYLYSGRVYKLAGVAIWLPFGVVELAVLDLLGKVEGKPVAELFGPMTKERVAVYVSRFEREQSVEESLARLEGALAEHGSGAKAVKLKIGGRMSRDADAFPGRTEAFIPAARQLLGDDFVIYVDANGSYGAERGIAVGHLLQDYGVAMYEEPCVFQDYAGTKAVTEALTMAVAGGEQDSSLWTWERMVGERIVDIVQPDFMYNGGFIRCLKVAAMAESAGMAVTPHSPIWGPASAIKAQFASLVPNTGAYQEHRALAAPGDWYTPHFPIGADGTIGVPRGPGWGVTYDPDLLRDARVL
ncbi:MAG: mandelate racemase/muconate lactonizing enzyme family protein [Bacteroidota bacterium]